MLCEQPGVIMIIIIIIIIHLSIAPPFMIYDHHRGALQSNQQNMHSILCHDNYIRQRYKNSKRKRTTKNKTKTQNKYVWKGINLGQGVTWGAHYHPK